MRSAHTALPISRSSPTFVAAFFALTIQFVYTDTPTHMCHSNRHKNTNTLFSACLSVYSRVYAISHTQTETQTHATMATATAVIHYYNSNETAFEERKNIVNKNEWTRLLGRFDLCALKHIRGP